MRLMIRYMRKYAFLFFLGVFCLSMEAACDLFQPALMSVIIDRGVTPGNLDVILRSGALMLAVTLFGAVMAVCRNFLASTVSQDFSSDMRSDLYKKVMNFPLDETDRFEQSSLITRMTNDVVQIQAFASGLMRMFVKAPIMCIGGMIMILFISLRLALILAVCIPAAAVLVYISMRLGYPLYTRVQKNIDRLNGVSQEYLSGVRVVKAFDRGDTEVERFGAINTDLSSSTAGAMRVMAIFSPGINLCINIGTAALLWFGGLRVYSGSLTSGQIIACVSYMTQILMAVSMLSNIFNMLVRAFASAGRVSEILKTEPSRSFSGSAVPDYTYGVAFDDVSFSYKGASGTPALEHITFSCDRGETMGIIGATGSGKSTLIHLITRLYDPTSGTVRVFGAPVADYDVEKLRSGIAEVMQKSLLFSGSVADNIRWGREDANMDNVRSSAQDAQAEDFIEAMPGGYDSLIGQGGVNLSGGQRQRLSIARALIRAPKLLMLDDCTSAVDSTTEQKIFEALRRNAADMTCVIISQRVASIIHCDKILVLENGVMAGFGSHETLAKTCPVYRDIYRSQIGCDPA